MKHRRFLSSAGIVLLLAFALSPVSRASAAAACSIAYTPQNDWGTGATIKMTINNTGTTAVSGWTLTWTFPGNQAITNLWNGSYTQTGTSVSVKNLGYNADIPVGGNTSFGFNLSYSGANVAPSNFALNGVACGGGGGATPTATPTATGTLTRTNTPTVTVSPTRTNTPTQTSTGVTNTPTSTSTPTNTNTPTQTSTGVTNTPTSTPTATATSKPGGLKVQLISAGTDNTQQSTFHFKVMNTGTTAQSNITARIYFTLDGSNAASGYALEKYYDQSGVATVSGPTLSAGTIYYFTVGYGSATLSAGGSWEFDAALHLSSWASTFSGTNDWWHTAGSLPSAYTDWPNIPLYQSGSLVWGSEPVTGPTPTPTTTPTITKTGTITQTPTITPTLTNPPPGTHLANPFVGAKWFVNPAWAAEVNASSVNASQKALLAQQDTAVWLDSMAAVNGTSGYPYSITGWLDQAESQGATLIIFIVYDLPQRDCAALASNGEIPGTAAGLTTYETQYINPIAAAESNSTYSNLRIINIVEPDSLPNLVTNLNISNCANANSLGLYTTGIEYALNKLHPIANTYNYLDIGHSGWLGWSSNFQPAVTLIANVIKATTAGVSSVDGFISDTANTVPVFEPFLTATESIGGSAVNSVTFYSSNPYIEEDTYDAAWQSAMRSAGLPASSTNMLVDTSRNGWGGCGGGPNVSQQCRPTGPSTATDVVTFVTMSRIDRRPARGDWCNQNGAGIGARPVANPTSSGFTYAAFVWIKPPGESDGSSSLIPTGPNNPNGKGFDQMCDPNYGGNSLNQNSPTNALPNAPVSGAWFEAQFDQLVANAWPAIS
jgi:cellulose 1,4-beta-cellobiosidase